MKRRGGSEIEVRKEKLKRWGIKGAGWLRAGSHGRLSVTSHTKGGSLSTCKADARTMLKEERTATLTQLLVAGLVIQGGKEADGAPVGQDVEETHEF